MTADIFINDDITIPQKDVQYRFSRSSGPGGQHVNKVETKVELIFDLEHCQVLNDEQKERLRFVAGRKFRVDGTIVFSSGVDRSRSANAERVQIRLRELVLKCLETPKARVATKPTRASKGKRRVQKQRHSQRKSQRSATDLWRDADDEIA